MCGIVGYVGNRTAKDVVIKGLQRLEYRGYDSAGIAVINPENKIVVKKIAGKVKDLSNFIEQENLVSNLGMGHTRWATHGLPNDTNAHPHVSKDGELAIIHNGIIENYEVLKLALQQKGYVFNSETDSEVLVHLIDYIQENSKVDIDEAVRLALQEVIGAYANVILTTREPNTIIAARKGSPLVVGIGNQEFFFASDATPIVEYTRNVIYLQDNEIAIVKDMALTVKTIENEVKDHIIQELEFDLESLEKGGFPHFMLKEIYEQPETILDCYRGRVRLDDDQVQLGGLHRFEESFEKIKRMIFVACGTSWHSALVAEYIIEELTRIPVEVEYASEFRYRNPIIHKEDIVIGISQSGETADTLAALNLAKEHGATVWGICNVVGSSIPRMTDAGIYTHCGPEIGVASTKAFTGQITAIIMMALKMAVKLKTIPNDVLQPILNELINIPNKVKSILEQDNHIKQIAEKFKNAVNFLYLGRGVNFPVALEGALKLKEISYIHAEGYPAAEMKHGPIALIDENMPVVVIATNKTNYEKVFSNVQEVKARKGVIISIVAEDDTSIASISDYVIRVPETKEVLSPLLAVIPLQLLAYHIAVMRDCDVDQPRNLAKSVTVE